MSIIPYTNASGSLNVGTLQSNNPVGINSSGDLATYTLIPNQIVITGSAGNLTTKLSSSYGYCSINNPVSPVYITTTGTGAWTVVGITPAQFITTSDWQQYLNINMQYLGSSRVFQVTINATVNCTSPNKIAITLGKNGTYYPQYQSSSQGPTGYWCNIVVTAVLTINYGDYFVPYVATNSTGDNVTFNDYTMTFVSLT